MRKINIGQGNLISLKDELYRCEHIYKVRSKIYLNSVFDSGCWNTKHFGFDSWYHSRMEPFENHVSHAKEEGNVHRPSKSVFRNAYIILDGSCEGKPPFERRSREWNDNLKRRCRKTWHDSGLDSSCLVVTLWKRQRKYCDLICQVSD